MIKKYMNGIIVIVLLFITFEMLSLSANIMSSVRFSLSIWKNNIFPSLFPFFVLTELLIYYGFVEFLSELFKKVMHFFRISPNASFVLCMSMLSGFPSSAKYTSELYQKKLLNKKEAEKILMFSHFSNPFFILGTIGLFLTPKIAFFVMFIHYGTNFIIGFLVRKFSCSKEEFSKVSIRNAIFKLNNTRRKITFGKLLSTSILNSINTLLLILGTMTVFLIITTIIDHNLNVDSFYQSIINGFFEMTQGIKYASELSMSLKARSVLMIMFISFGGLSVHIQTISILSDTDVRYWPYLLARILHSFLAGTLLYFLFDIFI